MPKSQTPIYVAKYPVTNSQFERFIKDGGYENPAYWGGEDSPAWRWRTCKPRYNWQRTDAPDFWDDPRFGKSRRGYPVVGVTWYEANAYCKWLEEQVTNCKLQIRLVGGDSNLQLLTSNLQCRLPTDEEWVASAGGEKEGEEDRYPWGPEWDESRANTDESGIGGTTPVGMYPSGQSPHGIWDMRGNVWEWLSSRVEGLGRETYALRGGSWNLGRGRVRVLGGLPGRSDQHDGFRVVASPAGSGS